MPASLEPQPPDFVLPTDRQSPHRTIARRWVLLVAIFALGLCSISQFMGGSGGSGGSGGGSEADRALAGYMLAPADLAQSAQGQPKADAFTRTSPPIDVNLAQQTVRAMTAGQAPLPDEKALATFREDATGFETTQAVLVYDDPQRAQSLGALAEDLLPRTLGLTSEPLTLAGVEDGRLWTRSGYRAISFRNGGTVVFVGTKDTRDPSWVTRLAEIARERLKVVEARQAQETAERAAQGSAQQAAQETANAVGK